MPPTASAHSARLSDVGGAEASTRQEIEVDREHGSPRVLVLSGLFPAPPQMPLAGTFIRERMFRLGARVPIIVVAPQPWFPLQALLRVFRPHFRPALARYEVQAGFEVYRPRYFSVPGVFKRFDGLFMALGVLRTVRALVRKHRLNILDAHFGYPEGHAASLLKRWLRLPVVLTLRGKEERQMGMGVGRALQAAVRSADRVICVSDALRDVALRLGAAPDVTEVIGNGVDETKFHRVDRARAREEFGLPPGVPVLVTVGTLVARKGFHRVLEVLPELIRLHGDIRYMIVGGAGAEGDDSASLRRMVQELGLEEHVKFTGPLAPERLRVAYSAADVFVLATSYEGWANVLLEAMACGLPVVTTDVGGNRQVVCDERLGYVVPFGSAEALREAISRALLTDWERGQIIEYAMRNGWGSRIDRLEDLMAQLLQVSAGSSAMERAGAR